MQDEPKPDGIAQFIYKLTASLEDGTFVRLVLSSRREGSPEKVLGRCIELKGTAHLSLTSRYATRDEVHNFRNAAGVAWIMPRLGSEFHHALLSTTQADWQLSFHDGKRARLVRHRPTETAAPARVHDQPHRTLVDAAARDWLEGLGVTDRDGKVRAAMGDKYSQIKRYVEILSHLGTEAGWIKKSASPAAPGPAPADWTIADMGCGKGYLTFGLWHLCRRVWQLPVKVVGVEARPELVAQTSTLAQRLGADDLQFVCGSIASAPLPPLRALIALHACDTATDDAILRGIGLGAQMIVVAPCCHKQVRPQLKHPAPLGPVLRHGLMEERMAEWVTDGLRALYLEWAGYQTKVFEFISSEHTAKNLMIAAIRQRPPFSEAAARARIEELKAFFGIASHPLDSLLAEAAAPT